MHIQTLKKLETLGWDSGILHYIHDNFAPKKSGKYKMKIYATDQNLLIDTAFFSDEQELSLIHHFYRGNGYVLYLAKTDKRISGGIINGAPFGEVEESGWRWLSDEEMTMRKPRRTNKENKKEK